MNAIIRTALLAFICVFLLNGCSTPSETPANSESQSLTIYTGRDKDEVSYVIDLFTQQHPEYKDRIQTVILGAQEALTRMRAEQANPQAGFLWGGTIQGLQQAANEGLLAPSHPTHADLIDASHKDPENRWFAEMLLPEVIVYNHDLLKPEQAPKDWDDLITPALKGKIVIRDVMASGTMRTIFSAMIYRKGADNPNAGYDWLRKLDANTITYAANPDDMYFKIDRGVGTVTLWNLQDALIQPLKNNRPWSYVIASSGVPVLIDGVGVVNNPRSMKAAEDFQNFLLEPKLQAQLAKDYYQIPAMTIPEADKPEWLTKLDLKEMKIDWNVMGEKEKEWMEYWSKNIKGKGGN